VTAALAVLLLFWFASTIWVQKSVSDAAAQQVIPVLQLNLFVEVVVLTSVSVAALWLIVRDRRVRYAKTRIDHLSEVAMMSGGFAHEARNLIHAMHTRLELLRKSVAGNDKAEERVDKLGEIAEGMEQLLADFLSFARPADNKLEETDPVKLVRQVLEFEELELERSGVQCSIDAAPQVPTVLVDRAKMKRALLNLIVNARQAMPEGGELHLQVTNWRNRVRIEIADTGSGIAPDDQARIFETYYSTKSAGTGLGLAIVRRTIEDLGGEITFASELNRGTTFYITLPTSKQQRARLKNNLQKLALHKTAG